MVRLPPTSQLEQLVRNSRSRSNGRLRNRRLTKDTPSDTCAPHSRRANGIWSHDAGRLVDFAAWRSRLHREWVVEPE